jgi:lipopolysaccharide export LptBFGC system permease protein LptF
MNLLDRYIARQYLQNILALFVLLFAIIIVIDFSLNFDEYIRTADNMHKAAHTSQSGLANGMTALYLVFDLWWPRLFLLYNFLLGLILVGAMGFTCAQMNRHREFVAILAGGISLHRVAHPILIVAVALTALAAVNRELIIPQLAPLLTREKGEAGTRAMGYTRQPLCADSRGRLFYAGKVDLDTGSIDGLWVWERDAQGLMTRRITADHAVWQDGRWLLTNGIAESRQASDQTTTTRKLDPIATFETDLDPTSLRLRRFEGYSNNLSTKQLTELIGNYDSQPQPPVSRVDRLERIRFGRIATLLSSVLILLLCLPFYLRREPGNLLLQSIMCAPVTLTSFVAAFVGASAAIPGLPPQISVFVPVMILIPLAIAAVTSIRT